MALNLSKAYTPSSVQIANSSSYNTDIANLFNAFSGLEGQTSTLGGLTITPSANGTTKFLVNNAAGTELFSLDTTNSYAKLKETGRFYFDGGSDTYIVSPSADEVDIYCGGAACGIFYNGATNGFILQSGDYLRFDGSLTGDTYMLEVSANKLQVVCGGTETATAVGSDGWYFPIGIKVGAADALNARFFTTSSGTGSTTMYIGNATITVSSDKRLKENIEETKTNALEMINKFRVVDFKWNDPTDLSINNRNARGKWTGLIAQEAVEVCPFIVNAPRPEGKEIDYASADKWFIEYQNFVPVLIKAIQELKVQVAALEEK